MSDLTDQTVITEPGFDAGETELLLFSLERSRAQFAWKAGGLSTEQLRQRLPSSSLTLGRLVAHLAWVEDEHSGVWITGRPVGPWSQDGARVDDDMAFGWAADREADELYDRWLGAVRRSREAWTAALADGGLDRKSALSFDGASPNLRRSLVDLCDEYARHVGHADLIRESIDGLVGEDPPQA